MEHTESKLEDGSILIEIKGNEEKMKQGLKEMIEEIRAKIRAEDLGYPD